MSFTHGIIIFLGMKDLRGSGKVIPEHILQVLSISCALLPVREWPDDLEIKSQAAKTADLMTGI